MRKYRNVYIHLCIYTRKYAEMCTHYWEFKLIIDWYIFNVITWILRKADRYICSFYVIPKERSLCIIG